MCLVQDLPKAGGLRHSCHTLAAAAGPLQRDSRSRPVAGTQNNGAQQMSQVEVKVPDIGDFKEVEVIEVMVKVGDTVKGDKAVETVESDKASMEIPSSQAGVVKEIKVKVGDKIAEGSLLVIVEADGASAPATAPAQAAAAAPAADQASAPPPAPAPAAAAPAAAGGVIEIEVPDIGDFKEVEVIEVMVKVGDT